jgi:phospholipase D1/2
MALDILDPNSKESSSGEKSKRAANGSIRKDFHQRSVEGGLFKPEFINNRLSWDADVLHKNEDAEERHGGESMTSTSPPQPSEATQNLENEDFGGDESTNTNNLRDNGGSDLFEVVSAQEYIPSQNGQGHDVNTPTWRRRFSLIPGNFTNPDTSVRWRDWKQALKFGKNRKVSNHGKTAVLQKRSVFDESEEAAKIRASNTITCLLAGSPAALFLASNFLQDDHGTRRAPLLLYLLSIDIEDVSKSGSRHMKYRLNLEYGIGPNRLKWSVVKDLRDFVSLHSRLKVSIFQSKNFKGHRRIELPKFPKSASKDIEGDAPTFNENYLSAPLTDGNFIRPSSLSSNSDHSGSILGRLQRIASKVSLDDFKDTDANREMFRRKLELYMKQLILALSLRPQANRLFQFFELSPLGVLLSYENGYHGKQGYLIVGSSSKAQGWRVGHLKFSDIKQMVQRHTNKWFLVRSSYIMYVSDIYSTTPLEVFFVDSSFKVSYSGDDNQTGPILLDNDNESFYDDAASINDNITSEGGRNSLPHVVIKLENGERELKMIAKSKNQAKMWVQSIQNMQKNTVWSKENRFNSFAPVRQNCFAQWFVDGRDHLWAISSAMEMAKDVIYIHDWWLSPELYMRRPANGNQEWRLDRILKRRAEQGVKIFVIVYRNVGSTVVTDSLWTKHSLIDLHPNIHVLRSPNQWLQNTYFWAHHEKICVIDHVVAFVGGIDLCYGRYDTPDHVLVDDSPHDFGSTYAATEETIQFQTFPGKDYSNPRVKDFYSLDKPYESMYDREVVPRMPWHDIHMMTAGEPARDLARHFVQRWNYLLRQKRPSRPTPILTPPPDFTPEELEAFDLTGTCEVQLLRSSGNWSLGLKRHEQSIQNAYLKLIETSEYYVYIENQFFITASAFNGTVIENRIGDALVDRIIRAHNEKKKWKAIIVIPLMPGFESEVDEAEGSAVRVIMECQYQSISRGTTSIFAKLKKMKINPYDYIQFYSLRKWGRIGPNRNLVSEQLYIHAKMMLVDDHTAIIGSANINERSQRGTRDSEVAAVVRDTELVNTTMDGKPFKASKFAHTLRMRLMREHLGIDVDILEIVEKRFNKIEELSRETKIGHRSKTHNFTNKDNEVGSSMVELASRDVLNMPSGTEKWKKFWEKNDTSPISSHDGVDPKSDEISRQDEKEDLPTLLQDKAHKPLSLRFHSFNNRAREENMGIRDNKNFSSDSRITNNQHHKNDVEGNGQDKMGTREYRGFKSNAARTLKRWASESLVNGTTDVFLPNVEQVLQFLNDDEFVEDPSLLTNEEELALAERNQERWDMLKRIAYLQRVAAKQKIQNDDENSKRAKVGISPLESPTEIKNESEFSGSTSGGQPSGVHSLGVQTSGIQAPDGQQTSCAEVSNPMSDFLNVPNPSAPSEPDFNEIENLPGHNIPVVYLDTAGIRRIVDSLNEVGGQNKFHKFIDPYSFGDPLDDAFYEDIWFDNAHRNTVIFREVFHCQPDDTVSTWKEYKEFTKLNTAFSLAQQQEVQQRESMKRFNFSSNQSDITDDEKDVGSRKHDSVRIEDINGLTSVEGILGNAPPHVESPTDQSTKTPEGPKRGRSGEYGFRKRSPLGLERVFDRHTADRILSEVQGHLVLFPTDWLWKEIEGGNWFYNMDRLPPIDIYD